MTTLTRGLHPLVGPASATRVCPVCGSGSDESRVYLENSIDPAKLSAASFASRKMPEYMSHRLVQCQRCDLVYVDSPPEASQLADAYHQASYDSSQEADDAASCYARAIAPLVAALRRTGSALEIGTGTGIFLGRLLDMGFVDVLGIEPSVAAIEAALPEHRRHIREGVFVDTDFQPDTFDLICCFMTLEHVRDPGELAGSAFRLLREGGMFVVVTHDYRSWVNRLLGAKSPIIDVEHMQLFSDKSIRRLFAGVGFRDVGNGTFRNRYALNYWLRLAPVPPTLKRWISNLLVWTRVGEIRLPLNVGNQLTYGFKRLSGSDG